MHASSAEGLQREPAVPIIDNPKAILKPVDPNIKGLEIFQNGVIHIEPRTRIFRDWHFETKEQITSLFDSSLFLNCAQHVVVH